MARVTVEDCLDNVDNRFQLVLVSSKRARQIAMGKEPMVEWENDKPTVVALREIAEGFITNSILDEKEESPAEEETEATEMEATEATAEAAAPSPIPDLSPAPAPAPSDEIIEATAENPVLKNDDE